MSKIRPRLVAVACVSRWPWLIIATLLMVLANIPIAPGHVVFDRILVFVLIILSLSQLTRNRCGYHPDQLGLAQLSFGIQLWICTERTGFQRG